MPTNYPGSSASYPANVRLPDDGDLRNATTLAAALEDLADRTAYIRAAQLTDEGDILDQGDAIANHSTRIGDLETDVAAHGVTLTAQGVINTAYDSRLDDLEDGVNFGAGLGTAGTYTIPGAIVLAGGPIEMNPQLTVRSPMTFEYYGTIKWRRSNVNATATLAAEGRDIIDIDLGSLTNNITLTLSGGYVNQVIRVVAKTTASTVYYCTLSGSTSINPWIVSRANTSVKIGFYTGAPDGVDRVSYVDLLCESAGVFRVIGYGV